jgi:hypothetical protein
MTLFGIAKGRLAFCKLLVRRGQILLDGVPGSGLPRDRCLELRLTLRRLPFGSEPLGGGVLFGSLKSGVGVSHLPFEHLEIREGFDPMRFQLRKAVRGRGGIDGCLPSGPLERHFEFVQPLVNQRSSRGGLRQARLILDLLVGKPRRDCRQVRGVAALGVANGRFGFGDLVSGSGERLLERFTDGRFLIESLREFCVTLGRLLSGGEAFSRGALFGSLQSGVGASQLSVEHLVGSGLLAKRCFLLRKPLRGRSGISCCFLSGPLEGRFEFAQPLINQVSSCNGLRQTGLILDLLVGKPRRDRRHVRGVAVLGVANGRFGFGDLVAGNRECPLERLTGGRFLMESGREFRVAFGSRRRVGQVVLSSAVECSGGLVQLPTHGIPSRSGFRYPSFVPCLLLVALGGRRRHG